MPKAKGKGSSQKSRSPSKGEAGAMREGNTSSREHQDSEQLLTKVICVLVNSRYGTGHPGIRRERRVAREYVLRCRGIPRVVSTRGA